MLTCYSSHGASNCAGVSRRDFVRFGALGIGGWTLGRLFGLQSRLLAASGSTSYLRDKSVVLLFLSGGASHIETFDPKMAAPDGVRSVTGEVKTSLAGVTMHLRLPLDRLDDRRQLLKSLDRMSRDVDATGVFSGYDRYDEQAFRVILGGATKAFDLQNESRRTRDSYDTSGYQVGFKKLRPSELGKHMLLARRMCEAGAGFVTVHSAGWDMHADGNNPGMTRGMEMLGRPLDKAVSAFLEDVESRGLSDKILLVITGDFGRTPKVNPRGGRDHWTNLCTLAFAGGGLKMGQVVGESDRTAASPAKSAVSTPHLMATLMHALFDVPQLRLQAGVPREIMQLVERGEPIPQLF